MTPLNFLVGWFAEVCKNSVQDLYFNKSPKVVLNTSMRLVQFVEGSSRRVGVEISDGGRIVDVCAVDTAIPRDMKSFLEGGMDTRKAAEK